MQQVLTTGVSSAALAAGGSLAARLLNASLLVSNLLAGCLSAGQAQATERSAMVDFKTGLDSWVAQQRTALAGLSCQQGDCVLVPVQFNDTQFNGAQFNGAQLADPVLAPEQTILVLDTDGMDLLSTLSYRERVQSVWHYVAGSGAAAPQLVKANPQLRVSKVLADFYPALRLQLQDLAAQHQQSAFAPADWFKPLHSELNRLSAGAASQYGGHGSYAVRYLAEHNPDARLVVATLPDFVRLFRDEFCRADAQALHSRISAFAAQFYQQVISGEQVRWINVSAGYDSRLFKQASQLCGRPFSLAQQQALLAAHQPFYQRLFDSDGVLAVQAGVVNNDPQRFSLDQPYYRHRIRAGFFNSGAQHPAVDARGVPLNGIVPQLPPDQHNSLAVLDVLINFGFDNQSFPCTAGRHSYRTSSMLRSAYGVICDEQTSWAAPVVLSRLLHLRATVLADQPWSDALLADLRQQLTPADCQAFSADFPQLFSAGQCKLQDPLFYRQHEVFRQGYLP